MSVGSGSGPLSAVTLAEIVTKAQFAKRLSSLRQLAGFSVRDLARQLGIAPATLGGYFAGRHLPTTSNMVAFQDLLRLCGVTDPAELAEWVALVTRLRVAAASWDGADGPPFPGLSGFQHSDARYFFGRSELIDESYQAVQAAAGSGRPVAIVGVSGSGKSSLLRAGLIPALQSAHPNWVVRTVLPGDLAALADLPDQRPLALCVDQMEELFATGDGAQRAAFCATLGSLAGSPGIAVVICLRADFFASAMTDPVLLAGLQQSAILVGSLTAAQLRQAIEEPVRLVGGSIDRGLAEMLLEELLPRDRGRNRYDEGSLPLLAHTLRQMWDLSPGSLTVADYQAVGGVAGSIEQTAEGAFDTLTADAKELSRAVFLRLVNTDEGGLVTRRRASLPEIYGLVGDAQVSDVRAVVETFVTSRMLTISDNSLEIAHEAVLHSWRRLRAWVDSGQETLRAGRELSRAAAMWLSADRAPEFLFRGSRLAAAEDVIASSDFRATTVEQDFVAASLTAHDETLLTERRRARRLRALLALAMVLTVIVGSLAVWAARSRTQALAKGQEAAQAQANALAEAEQARLARDEAQSRRLAVTAERLRQTEPGLAAYLAMAAYRVSPTLDGRSAVLDSAATPAPYRVLGRDGTTMLASSANGTLAAVGNGGDGSTALYRIDQQGRATRLTVLPPVVAGSQPFAITFSADSRLLAIGSSGTADHSGGLQIWDLKDPEQPQQLPPHAKLHLAGKSVQGLSFSAGGTEIAAVGDGGVLRRWQLSNGRILRQLPDLAVGAVLQAVVYSPDGALLFVGGINGELKVYRRNGDHFSQAQQVNAGGATIMSLQMSPDGHTLYAGSKDGRLQAFVLTPDHVVLPSEVRFTSFSSWVNAITVSADGSRVLAGSSDSWVREFDAATGAVIKSLPHGALVTGVRYLAGERSIGTTATDGTLRIWPNPGTSLDPAGAAIFTTAVVGATLYLGAGRQAGGILRWDISDRWRPRPLARLDAPSQVALSGAIAASPNGQWIAAGTMHGQIQLWRSDGTGSYTIAQQLSAAAGGTVVQGLAFSNDNKLLAAAIDNIGIVLFDLRAQGQSAVLSVINIPGGVALNVALDAAGTVLAAPLTTGKALLLDISDPVAVTKLADINVSETYVYTATFAPDGRTLVTSAGDRLTRMWDLTHPRKPAPLGGPLTGPVSSATYAVFSPDGRSVAVTSAEGVVWIWDIASGPQPTLTARLWALKGPMNTVQWTDDSAAVIAGGGNRIAVIWPLDAAAAISSMCQQLGAPMTLAEWQRYVPDLPYRNPCGT